MSIALHLKTYAACIVAFFALDILWLGVIARGFYRGQLGHLLRAETFWPPAIAFYLIYVAAITILCVLPAVEKDSLTRAVALGAVFGLAAYAAFDLTALALLKDFPARAAYVDLVWGVVLTATVSAVGFFAATALAS